MVAFRGFLEWNGAAFTHATPACWPLHWRWTKQRSKGSFFRAPQGLPVVEKRNRPASTVRGRKCDGSAYVVKPNNEARSVGVYLVEVENNGPAAVGRRRLPAEVMVEKFVRRSELTTTVMGQRASP